MSRRSSNGLAIVVGLVLVGIAMRGAKRGAKPSAFKPWSDNDAQTFLDELTPLGIPIDALLQVYAAESGLDPKASSGIAWGLCQAIEPTLKGAGWFASHKKASEFGQLTVAQQAPWLANIVASQIRMIGFVPKNATDFYAANFNPSAARAKADVMYSAPSTAYTKNRNLDQSAKGFINRADLAAALARARAGRPYLETSEQLRRLNAKPKAIHGRQLAIR
jgi:hypothetical protein